MLWVDTAILMLIGIVMAVGIFRGYIREFFAVVVWLMGIVVGWFFSQNFSLFLVEEFADTKLRLAFSFSTLLAITLVTGWMISYLLADSLKITGLSILARFGGALVGFVHGVLVVFVFILLAGLTSLPKDSWWVQSVYITHFQALVAKAQQVGSGSKLASLIDYSPRLNLQAK